MKTLRRFYYKIFKHYERLQTVFVPFSTASQLIRDTYDKPEHLRWVLAIPEEDNNGVSGFVFLARQRRITE